MTEKQQRIAIAKALGMEVVEIGRMLHLVNWPQGYPEGTPPACPQYTTDLNAMREAVVSLSGLTQDSHGKQFPADGFHAYVAELYRVVNRLHEGAYYHWSDLGTNEAIVATTAAQQAEAFLRTLNLWQDDEP
ncbi:MAG: hypothetical protein WC718_00285 [Phycisphaerales bacterium]|jgi:hypothetical protein